MNIYVQYSIIVLIIWPVYVLVSYLKTKQLVISYNLVLALFIGVVLIGMNREFYGVGVGFTLAIAAGIMARIFYNEFNKPKRSKRGPYES